MRNIKKILVFVLLAVFAFATARSLAYFTDYTSFEYKGGAGTLFFKPIQDLSPPDSLTNMFPGDARDLLVGAVNAGTSAMDVRMTITLTVDENPDLPAGSAGGFNVYHSKDISYTEATGYKIAEGAQPLLTRQGDHTLQLGVFAPGDEITSELTLIFKKESEAAWQGQDFYLTVALEGRQYINAYNGDGGGGWAALAEYSFSSDGG